MAPSFSILIRPPNNAECEPRELTRSSAG